RKRDLEKKAKKEEKRKRKLAGPTSETPDETTPPAADGTSEVESK
ncbi:MAG: hypothetical protein JWL90_2483, partial [Chthoniobacteraceae bacterium]|nr:hypothetical protein [Chthoniobacteraceae bacterium]